MNRRRLQAAVVVMGFVAASPGRVAAQVAMGPYVGGGAGWLSMDSSRIEAANVGFTFSGGVPVLSWLDAEVEISRTGHLSASRNGTISFAQVREDFERLSAPARFSETTGGIFTIGGAALFHARRPMRVMPAFVAGISWLRSDITYQTDVLETPAGVTDVQVAAYEGRVARVSRLQRAAGTLGVNTRIALTPHLAVVPDFRLDMNRYDRQVRSSVRVQWRF